MCLMGMLFHYIVDVMIGAGHSKGLTLHCNGTTTNGVSKHLISSASSKTSSDCASSKDKSPKNKRFDTPVIH